MCCSSSTFEGQLSSKATSQTKVITPPLETRRGILYPAEGEGNISRKKEEHMPQAMLVITPGVSCLHLQLDQPTVYITVTEGMSIPDSLVYEITVCYSLCTAFYYKDCWSKRHCLSANYPTEHHKSCSRTRSWFFLAHSCWDSPAICQSQHCRVRHSGANYRDR